MKNDYSLVVNTLSHLCAKRGINNIKSIARWTSITQANQAKKYKDVLSANKGNTPEEPNKSVNTVKMILSVKKEIPRDWKKLDKEIIAVPELGSAKIKNKYAITGKKYNKYQKIVSAK